MEDLGVCWRLGTGVEYVLGSAWGRGAEGRSNMSRLVSSQMVIILSVTVVKTE